MFCEWLIHVYLSHTVTQPQLNACGSSRALRRRSCGPSSPLRSLSSSAAVSTLRVLRNHCDFDGTDSSRGMSSNRQFRPIVTFDLVGSKCGARRMETVNRILQGLNGSTDGLDLLESELNEELLQEKYKRLSQHEQVKLLHAVHQLFLKATKVFFSSNSDERLSPATHDSLYSYCLTWIRITSKSFAGTPLTIINMFLNDAFRFDKSIDIAFQETNALSSQLFIHVPYPQLSYPISSSLSWCLLSTYQPTYAHLRTQTIQTILSIVQAKNFHTWIQQTLFKKPFRLEKDNKLIQVLSRLLKLSNILLYFCNDDNTEAIKDGLNFMRIIIDTFADSPYFHNNTQSPLFHIALHNMQGLLHFSFETHNTTSTSTTTSNYKQNSNKNATINATMPLLSARATACLSSLQHLLFSQKANLFFLYLLQAQYDCSGCDAFYVDISSLNATSTGKKRGDGKLLLMSILLGMMKNKDERIALITFCKQILHQFATLYFLDISRVMNFLTRLLSEPLENMRVFAGEWIGYLWETMQTMFSDNAMVMINTANTNNITNNVQNNIYNTGIIMHQTNTTNNAFTIYFKQQSLVYPCLSDAHLLQLYHLLHQLLTDSTSHLVRASAAAAIRHFPKGKFVLLDTNILIQTLIHLTQDKTGKVRGAAQGALGDVSRSPNVSYDRDALLSVFIQGSQDSSLIVRLDAFWALSKYLPSNYIPFLFNNMTLHSNNANNAVTNTIKSNSNAEKVTTFFESDTARTLLSLYQHAIVSDSDKILPSLVLGYLSFVLIHNTTNVITNSINDNTLSSVQLLLSQFRHEIDTRLQRFLSLEMLLQPQVWDEAPPEIMQAPEKLKQWKQLTNNKDITNIFALVFCLDVFVDVQDNLNMIANHNNNHIYDSSHNAVNSSVSSVDNDSYPQETVRILPLNVHLWERVLSLFQSRRVYLQLQASQWLLACLFASVSATCDDAEGILSPEYPKELYLRLLEEAIALFFKTAHRLKTFHYPTNNNNTSNNSFNTQNHHNNFSRSLALKRLLLLMITRLIHIALSRSVSYADLITQIVRFHLEKLVSEMETMYLSSAIVSWTNVFTFYPLFDSLGLLRGLQTDLGETLSDKSIVEYAAMVVQLACGMNNTINNNMNYNSNNNSNSYSIEVQNIAPSVRLRLHSLYKHSSSTAAAPKAISYSSFDGLDVVQELPLFAPQTTMKTDIQTSPEKNIGGNRITNHTNHTYNNDMEQEVKQNTVEEEDDPDEI